MDSAKTCSHTISRSPLGTLGWGKMVIWDWYDGPETGLFICDICQAEFYFYLVDWSDNHDIRIFALQSIRAGAITTLVNLVDEVPKWPIWWPQKLIFPSDTDRPWIDQLDNLVLGQREEPRKLLAWSNAENKPLGIAQIPAKNTQNLDRLLQGDYVSSPFDWLGCFGLSR
jgi:hypothetical protein